MLTHVSPLPCSSGSHSSIRVLGSSSIIRHRQQIRCFRWASYVDPTGSREFRRRHRFVKHKYAETLNRRLSWEKHPFADDAKIALKRIMKGSWQADRAWRGSSWAENSPAQAIDALQGKPQVFDSTNSVEDPVYRKTDFSSSTGLDQPSRTSAKTRKSRPQKTPSFLEIDYVIDPITNRRIAKHPAPSNLVGGFESPNKSFKDYRSQFGATKSAHPTPIFYDGPPPAAELNEYAKIDPTEQAESYDVTQQSAPSRNPLFRSDEYVKNHNKRLGREASGNDKYVKWSYNSVSWKQEGDSELVVKTYSGRGSFAVPAAQELSPEELSQYEPVAHQEPYGQPPPSAEEVSKEYNDLDQYKPVRHEEAIREPGEAPVPTSEEQSKQYDDLDQYKPIRHEEAVREPGEAPVPTPEEQSKQYDDLDQYGPVKHQEPDGKPARTIEEKSKDYDDLHKYGAVRYQEPDGKPARTAEEKSKDYDDLHTYGSVMYNEPDGKPARTTEEKSKDYTDLHTYGSVLHNEPDGKPARTKEEKSKDYNDLHTYGSIMHNEPDGKAPISSLDTTAAGLESADSKNDYSIASRLASLDLDRADKTSAEVIAEMEAFRAPSPVEHPSRSFMSAQMRRHEKASDALDMATSSSLQSAKASRKAATHRKLTGNYVRDFPEEFSKSWNAGSTAAYRTEQDAVNTHASFNVETSLERGGKRRRTTPAEHQTVADYHSRQPTYTRSHGIPDAVTVAPGTTSSQPTTLYKILAYDHSMQKVDVAETTSITPDQSTPLTPAEVLVRLSNPSKFLPHFAPLQAEGYEIFSGSGDVLIFRKVRELASDEVSTSINPIDMMGRSQQDFVPASANFASPTGFVNYDTLHADDTTLPPPPAVAAASASPSSPLTGASTGFPSQIDVRRSEPVFSGQRLNSQHGEESSAREHGTNKPSVVKRLAVGAACVAGVSYALGVAGELLSL